MKKWHAKGFTALELVVTMTIIAVLLSAGIPTFRDFSWNLRMKTAMDSLQADLNLARGHAISHNIQTVICPALDSSGCSGQSIWQDGWIVFSDLNGDRQKQNGEPLLKRSGMIAMLTISSSAARSHLRFYPNGSAPGSNASILFCDPRGPTEAGIITLSNSGRIRMQAKAGVSAENCP